MKNDIQNLILELDAEKEKAFRMADKSIKCCEKNRFYGYKGQEEAFSLCIQKLTLLLESENEKQR